MDAIFHGLRPARPRPAEPAIAWILALDSRGFWQICKRQLRGFWQFCKRQTYNMFENVRVKLHQIPVKPRRIIKILLRRALNKSKVTGRRVSQRAVCLSVAGLLSSPVDLGWDDQVISLLGLGGSESSGVSGGLCGLVSGSLGVTTHVGHCVCDHSRSIFGGGEVKVLGYLKKKGQNLIKFQ
jgi:hypothetical protein